MQKKKGQRGHGLGARERTVKQPFELISRKCLKCSEKFLSDGSRVCPACTLANRNILDYGVEGL